MSKRKVRKKPVDEATFYIQSSKDKPGLMERFIDDNKGRGIFATQPIEQGDFVIEYRGRLLPADECQTRKYSGKESTFLFEFEWQNRHWCIDASKEDGSLGRLVNDNHKSPNCTMEKIIVNNKPHLCLFAIKKIEIGTEIDYNYGDSKWPWREKFQVTGCQAPAPADQLHKTFCDSPSDDTNEQDNSQQINPNLSDATYDSSNDSVEEPSVLLAMDSQRPTRASYFSGSFAGLDETCEDGEEEYVPETSEESSDSDASMELPINKSPKDKIMLLSQNRSKFSMQGQIESSQRIFGSHGSRAATCEDESASLEEASVFVAPVLKKEDGSRTYAKKHQCVYCGVLVQKMSRHLMRKHMNKVEVAKAYSLPKNSKQRRLQLDYLRNKGNFEHNTEVLESNKGKLIAWKQPKEKTEGDIFKHCLYCYGLFNRKAMWRHFQTCKFKPEDKSSKTGRTRVQALCAFAEPVPPEFSDSYWRFLSEMHQDDITVACKKDNCILKFGYRLFHKNKMVSHHPYIRQKLRELGRLLLEAKKIAPVKSIKDLIKPEKYVQVVSAARRLAGFCEESGKYHRPSLARKVGHNIHSLALFIKSEGLKSQDKQSVKNAEKFAQLYQESWNYDIASQALTQLQQRKWNAPLLLPFTHDVQILHNHLSEKQQEYLRALTKDASQSNWKDLAKVILAQVILFNRRRAGEVSRMHLSVYLSKDTSTAHEDVNLALTALEQKLCNYFVRITIVGKRGRKVPVLLSPQMKESLDTLTEKREECGVLKENLYLFALPNSFHYLRGSDCIRQLVSQCSGLKDSTALTSTKLRKHIATLSTVLNLKTTELDQLADFLGHNIAVHRKHYRLPEGTVQLAKVSKVLLALEQGRLGEYKGKSLDEIHLDVNEPLDTDETFEEKEEQIKGAPEETPCAATSSGSQKALTKKRDELMPEVVKVTPSTPASSDRSNEKSAKKRGNEKVVKRNWTPEECAAVNKHLRKYIVTNRVPGKVDCENCIAAEPQVLSNRDWKAVKYFVKNRITTMRKKYE
ncbi:uncharacterized protein LOC106936497 [Poecilia latipinna]|uniref:uncharacterized protein LOC106936497 n=1 Tax=Poecilia latipinna TaxID=48699 RepID=UPI00072D9F9C|nr:PREDICTED: uncharacterized protein LOC106936497 [Poecilia latipinna]